MNCRPYSAEISEMWTLVYQQLENAYQSVLNADKQLADKVVAREKRVNAFELKIDSDIEDCRALYNPVAIDLRFTLAMLKINTNLERIGRRLCRQQCPLRAANRNKTRRQGTLRPAEAQ